MSFFLPSDWSVEQFVGAVTPLARGANSAVRRSLDVSTRRQVEEVEGGDRAGACALQLSQTS